jgi:hypothetical protein
MKKALNYMNLEIADAFSVEGDYTFKKENGKWFFSARGNPWVEINNKDSEHMLSENYTIKYPKVTSIKIYSAGSIKGLTREYISNIMDVSNVLDTLDEKGYLDES